MSKVEVAVNLFNCSDYNILIVDDEVALASLIAEELADYGYEIFVANCGNDALAIIAAENITLVISDMKMPNGSGVELVEKAVELSPRPPIFLMMTGFADITEDELKKKGAERLLEKPIKCDELAKIIEMEIGAKK